MAELTNGKIDTEEYFILFNTAQCLKNNTRVPRDHAYWLSKAKKLQNKDLIIVDDFDMNITTSGKEYTDSVRHYMGFSAQPMYQNHMKTSVESVAQLASNGYDSPDMFVTQHNQEEVGVSQAQPVGEQTPKAMFPVG